MSFYRWETTAKDAARSLIISDAIYADEDWSNDSSKSEVDDFISGLRGSSDDIEVWINSPGGDVVLASQIYTALKERSGKVTVKIDGIAASAASVIAMAGDEVLMSPTSSIMIHDPATVAGGNLKEMQSAMNVLEEVKENIINAYVLKTKLSRNEISEMMERETWLGANLAVKKGFADGVLFAETAEDYKPISVTFAQTRQPQKLIASLKKMQAHGRKVDDLLERINLIEI